MKKKLARALSARIKTLRETSGLSQQEVAERGELSMSLVAKLEQGKKADPRASTLLALAKALGVTPGTLLDDLVLAKKQQAEKTIEESEAEALAEGRKEKPAKKKDQGTREKPQAPKSNWLTNLASWINNFPSWCRISLARALKPEFESIPRPDRTRSKPLRKVK